EESSAAKKSDQKSGAGQAPSQSLTKKAPVRSFTQATQKRTQNRAPVNFEALESLGTLTAPRSGTLGIDIWDDTDRAQIVKSLKQLTAVSSAPPFAPPALVGVLKRALLST